MNHPGTLCTRSVRLFASLLALVLISVLPVSTALAVDNIVVYNAQHESLGRAWFKGFEQATGITVTVRHGEDMEIANQLVLEGTDSPADVFLTENSPGMTLVDAAGLLSPLSPRVIEQVPELYRATSGNWTGIAARETVFAYDKTRLGDKDLPKSVLDLATPEWQDRWGVSPTGADFQAIVAAMLQLEGQETTTTWLKGLKENAVQYRGNSTAMKAVNAGQVDGALIYHYYYFGDQAGTGENSANVALHYFGNQDPGAFVSVSGGAVLASSQNREAAEKFLESVTGEHGQAVLRDGDSFEYAIAKGAASNPALVPLAELDAPKINPSTLDSKAVSKLMIDAGLL